MSDMTTINFHLLYLLYGIFYVFGNFDTQVRHTNYNITISKDWGRGALGGGALYVLICVNN